MPIDESTVFSPGTAAQLAVRYREVCLEMKKLEEEKDTLNKILKAHITETKEPICVEGQPPLKVISRRGRWNWDVKAMKEQAPMEYHRLLDLECLTVNGPLAQKMMQAGHLTGAFKNWGHQGLDDVLVFES